MDKKFLITIIIVLLFSFFYFSPNSAFATKDNATSTESSDNSSVQELQKLIEQLQNQIKELQEQLAGLKSEIKEVKEELRLTKTLYKGLSDEEVKEVQKFLSQFREIYPEGLLTGYYGSLTEKAVKKFQEKYGIPSTGLVGPLTREKMNEFLEEEKKEEKVIICHVPLGNPASKHTLTIGKSALEAHLAHGDAIGTCPEPIQPTPAPAPTPTPTPTPTSTSATPSVAPPVASPNLPDLEFFGMHVSYLYANDNNMIIASLKNMGDAPITQPFITKIYVNGTEVGLFKMGSDLYPTHLSPGSNFGPTINYTFTAPGNYEIKAVADTDNVIKEISENNNVISRIVSIGVVPQSMANLEAEWTEVSHSYANQSNSIRAMFANRGTVTVPKESFATKFYVNGVLAGEVKHHGVDILPNTYSNSARLNYTFPSAGDYEIKAVVDAVNSVVESSEDDNTLTVTVHIR